MDVWFVSDSLGRCVKAELERDLSLPPKVWFCGCGACLRENDLVLVLVRDDKTGNFRRKIVSRSVASMLERSGGGHVLADGQVDEDIVERERAGSREGQRRYCSKVRSRGHVEAPRENRTG